MDDFSILPAEITSEILIRLPTESVLDCKSVSKTWRNLIQQPSFCKMHSNRQINHDANSGNLGFLASKRGTNQLYYFEYVENHESPVRRVIIKPPFQCYTIVGSFNGLVCLCDDSLEDGFCICNPTTKESIILPKPKSNFGRNNFTSFGFGYLPSTNEYKVVVVNKVKKEASSVEVMVYTLGSRNGWRNIGKFNQKLSNITYRHGIFTNAALHWMDTRTPRKIIIFDLAEEKFCDHLSLRPLPGGSLKLGVLGGFLFCAPVYYCPRNRQLLYDDIWLYQKKIDNYNVKEKEEHQTLGWTKGFAGTYNWPLAFTKSGDVLSYTSGYLYIYDPKASIWNSVVHFEETFHQVCPHKNTLVSLKELGEEGTEKMEPLKINK